MKAVIFNRMPVSEHPVKLIAHLLGKRWPDPCDSAWLEQQVLMRRFGEVLFDLDASKLRVAKLGKDVETSRKAGIQAMCPERAMCVSARRISDALMYYPSETLREQMEF